MKQALTIEGSSEAAASLLLHLAILLSQHKLHPNSLVWTVAGPQHEVRIWMVLDGDATELQTFAEDCRNQAGVRYVAQLPAEDRTPIFARIHALESRSPFAASDKRDPTQVIAEPTERARPEFMD